MWRTLEGPVNAEGTALDIFLRSFVGQTSAYFVVVTLIYLGIWRFGRAWFARFRIPTKRKADAKQIRSEVGHTLGTLAVGTVNATVILLLYREGHTALSTDATVWTWPWVLLQIVGLVVFNDAWFYAVHRLLHQKWVFQHVHAVHHRSIDVNPFTSYSFHFAEALLIGAWSIPVMMFVPMYLPAFGVVQAIGLLNNVMSHLGYELLPRWILRVPGLRWMNSATFHSLHHTRFNGNYGLFFRFWDRMLGTEVPGYEAAFLARGGAGGERAEGVAAE